MGKYCITGARPKNATHHLNSEFKLWKWDSSTGKWTPQGWKRTAEIAALLDAKNEVLTAKEGETSIASGAAVEVELRIAKNEAKFKISDMPDK